MAEYNFPKERPEYGLAIICAVDGIMRTLELEDECNMAWGLLEYEQSDFDNMHDYLYERIRNCTTDYGVIYNMMLCGEPVYVYDCETMTRTQLTFHNLDATVQDYLKLEPDYVHWTVDDYDVILQYALYGNLVHI